MASNSRPSLDSLVPLVMIDNNVTNHSTEDVPCEEPKALEVLRDFESGDIVLVRSDSQCLPAIVFNISGLVMKFDIDRQLYHVCLLDNQFTDKWVDAMDMIIYSVPMIAECQNEQETLMWTTANEFLEISNTDEDNSRLGQFKKRFTELRHQQAPLLSANSSRKSRQSRTSIQKPTQQITLSPLTTCEELHIIDSIYQLPQCTYAEAKRTADDTYMKIICTNNRENIQSGSIGVIPDYWFITFAIQKIAYFRQYAAAWLPDLKSMVDTVENQNELHSLIALMKTAA